MKKLSTILLLIFSYNTYSQFGINAQWTWIKGDNTFNQPGNYGTKGITLSSNKPSARTGSATWTDASGNTYIYSGNNYADMWKYEPATNNWTWVQGDNAPNTSAVYGSLNVANANNSPGTRQEAAFWKDNNGMFWLYGGTNRPDDLWKFDPSTNIWTWVKGNNTGTVASIYNPANARTPGSRSSSNTWVDATGNLWLFGGMSAAGFSNELWKYDIAINEWQNFTGISGPTPRSNAVTWSNNGELYLFGGVWSFETPISYNDLYKYNTSTNTWTQLKINLPSNYGTKGVASSANNPKERFGAAGWKDNNGDFWMYGGMYPNPACSTACAYGTFEDLWKYDVSANQWTWMKGTTGYNGLGEYGSTGIAAATNKPPAKTGAISFADNSGNFYLFGGRDTTTNYFNDLWEISGVALPLKLISFEGTKKEKGILLNWQTTNELNTSHFNIQKSNDGNSFRIIGRINAVEDNVPLKNYSFMDNSLKPGEELFYRLEIIDKDGSKNYSAAIHVKNPAKFYVGLTPNPAKSELNVHIASDKTEMITILLRDFTGKVFKKETLQATNGNIAKAINISELSAGTYIVTVMSSSELINQELIKL